MKQQVLGSICLALAASIWGGMFVASKYVLEFIPPFTLMCIRYSIGSLLLFSIMKVRKKTSASKTKRDWMLLIWIGFIGYLVTISFQFIGVELSNAHTGALITATTPVFIVVFARIILKEEITYRKAASLVLASVGVFTVIEWNTQMNSYLLGSFILFMAAVCWALLSIYVKKASSKFTSLEITANGILIGLMMTIPFMIGELQYNSFSIPNLNVIFGIIYLGIVSTAGGFYFWNKGMELMEAGVGSLFYFFQPLTGALLGWLLLDESLSAQFFIGFFLIMCGIFIVTWKPKRKRTLTSSQYMNKVR
ncbi:DMT family transporter [Halobacillus halophilus]|uniref:DMT family transporter n=1 Tax=Halobacillus halophilus TaxID=1570 RepID=UPI001CD675A7|nr:DMT family transporter [Halobacillus halophilus]MCA1010485.1 DMT family transporter [Halobacillus halophilus]